MGTTSEEELGMQADTRTLGRWTIHDIVPDTTVHAGVEVRELQFDPRGAHITHVRMSADSRIVGTVHNDEHETIYVLRGYVMANIDGQEYIGQPGTIFNIPSGTVHGYTPITVQRKIRTLSDALGIELSVVELLAIYAPND